MTLSKKYIISGTNRPESRSLGVSQVLQKLYKEQDEEVEIINLIDVGLEEVTGADYGSEKYPDKLQNCIEKISQSNGLIIVVPEYNGSMPGILKYFIDFWRYPQSFERRPVCFVGLGGLFGGLRPVEHIQQVFSYRNAFVYPDRVFLINVWNILKNNTIEDETVMNLLRQQVKGFQTFCATLHDSRLHANQDQG